MLQVVLVVLTLGAIGTVLAGKPWGPAASTVILGIVILLLLLVPRG